MKNIQSIKADLQAINILSTSEITQIKGGNNDNGGQNAQNDDKRRSRPGGGVSTL